MLELKRHDWSKLGAQGSAARVPQAIDDLLTAATIEQAESAYWRIDNVVVVQGSLHDAALPTVRAVLAGLPSCTEIGRPLALELLVQLGSGTNHPDATNESLAADCRTELLFSANHFFYLFEHGSTSERNHCIDLLGLCASCDKRLLSRVRWYFQWLLQEGCSHETRELVENTISELETEA